MRMPYEPPPNLADLTLDQIAELAEARKLPPVARWDPPKSGDSEMRIAADGRWFHQGGEITRPAMIRAFSSLLKLDDDGRYWLVTPQEKLRIEVDDVPFIAVEVQREGGGRNANLAFRLNTDDLVIAGPNNALVLRNYDGADVPYLHVRNGLWARVSRPLHYELMELAVESDASEPCLWSDGTCFPMVTPA
jgi:uncharacterized protein